MGTGIKGQFRPGITGPHRRNPGIDIVFFLFQILVGILHFHLVAVKPPARDKLAITHRPFSTDIPPVFKECWRRRLVFAPHETLHLAWMGKRVDVGTGRLAVNRRQCIFHRRNDLVVPHRCPRRHVDDQLDVPRRQGLANLHQQVTPGCPGAIVHPQQLLVGAVGRTVFPPVLAGNENDITSPGTLHRIGKPAHVKGVDRPVIGFGRVVLEGLIMKHQSIPGFRKPALLPDNLGTWNRKQQDHQHSPPGNMSSRFHHLSFRRHARLELKQRETGRIIQSV